MNRRVRWAMGTALVALAASPPTVAQDRMFQTPPDPETFRDPPSEARPQILHPAISGNVTKEGIDADLQAMRNIGFGGVMVVDGGDDGPAGPVEPLSPQWLELMTRLTGKADQLGLKVGLRWPLSGGPWIAPQQAMQQIVWTESRVSGDGDTAVSIKLPQPYMKLGYYRDAAAIAFPASPGDETTYRDAVEAMESDISIIPGTLTDRDLRSTVEISPSTPLVVTMKAPFAAQAMTLYTASDTPALSVVIAASADGVTWSRIGRVNVGARQGIEPPGTLNFASVEASMFRFTPSARVQLAEVLLHATPRIDQWETKAGHDFPTTAPAGKPTLDLMARYAIDPAEVIDISAHVDASGTLNWTPPAGEWTVLRFGHTPTGQFNAAASDTARGLEIDRLSIAAVDQ